MRKYIEFCSGCGLCSSAIGVEFKKDEKGFMVPILDKKHEEFCSKYCHDSNNIVQNDNGGIWGEYLKACYCYSNDDFIRNRASSGGGISSLCIYLIDNNIVDGIIQTTVDPHNPLKTITVISYTKEEIIKCSGSRYTGSHPLKNIINLVDKNKRYVFVGKPCDVRSLRLYINDHEELINNVIFFISFFCAGVPSEQAEMKLLKRLGCSDIETARELTYRGNGWPGKTSLIQKNGNESKISYEEAWGNILGRDVRKSCRYCFDGVGKAADVSFGDGWILDDNGKPIFDNRNGGRNCVLIRTSQGEELFNNAVKSEYIVVQEMDNPEITLKHTQPYQFERTVSMRSMLLALSLLGKEKPQYSKALLKRFSKEAPIKVKLHRFLGTIKRNLRRN